MLDGVIRGVRARRYRPPIALVQVEQWANAASGDFAVGIPWPWYTVDDEATLPRTGLELLIAAPRTDGQVAMIEFTVELDEFELDDKLVSKHSREFARQLPGGSGETPRRLIIGGIPAVEFVASSGGEQRRLLLVPDGAKTYRARTVFPSVSATGYGVHLDAVLASWQWA